MDDTKHTYAVEIMLPGSPSNWHTLVNADTAEAAGEVVRILLAQNDPNLTELHVVRRVKL